MEYSSETPKLGFSNDLVFSIVMRDERIARLVIEAVTERKVGRIEYHNTQQEERGSAVTRGVRMDVYLEDERTAYDVEMQASHQADLGMRYRFYQSMMDAKGIEKGAGFPDLKNSFIIFICTYDPFEMGLPLYTFEPMCLEDRAARMETRQQWLALNSRAWFRAATPELRELLEYVQDGTVAGSMTSMLDEAVEHANSSDEVRRQSMITLEQKRASERKAAKEIGKAEGKAEVLDGMAKLKESLELVGRDGELIDAIGDKAKLDALFAEFGIQ